MARDGKKITYLCIECIWQDERLQQVRDSFTAIAATWARGETTGDFTFLFIPDVPHERRHRVLEILALNGKREGAGEPESEQVDFN